MNLLATTYYPTVLTFNAVLWLHTPSGDAGLSSLFLLSAGHRAGLWHSRLRSNDRLHIPKVESSCPAECRLAAVSHSAKLNSSRHGGRHTTSVG